MSFNRAAARARPGTQPISREAWTPTWTSADRVRELLKRDDSSGASASGESDLDENDNEDVRERSDSGGTRKASSKSGCRSSTPPAKRKGKPVWDHLHSTPRKGSPQACRASQQPSIGSPADLTKVIRWPENISPLPIANATPRSRGSSGKNGRCTVRRTPGSGERRTVWESLHSTQRECEKPGRGPPTVAWAPARFPDVSIGVDAAYSWPRNDEARRKSTSPRAKS